MAVLIIFLGIQAIETITIVLLLDAIGALPGEEHHQGNLLSNNLLYVQG